VSQENVEIVVRLQPAPEVDLVRLLGDDKTWAALAPSFHMDVVSVMHGPGQDTPLLGLDGLRTTWLDWLAPWAAYRTEVERTIDLGERVMVFVCDFARREGSEPEVPFKAAAVWTVRDGKIARVEFYPDRTEALEAVGLTE
jgi:ketosteroid isomerase-like protein